MRNVFAFLIGLTFLATGHAVSAEQGKTPETTRDHAVTAPQRAGSSKARLDDLFADLKRERNEKAAERIAGRIWEEWFKSGSATVDLMMQWSSEALEAKKY